MYSRCETGRMKSARSPLWAILGMMLIAVSQIHANEIPSDDGDFLFLYLHPSIAKNLFTFKPQLDLANAANIDRFVGDIPFPKGESPDPSEWQRGDDIISMYFQGNDTAKMAPRVYLVANVG